MRLTTPTRAEQFLRVNGPSLSSEIAASLVAEGITASNARKLVQRSGPRVGRLHGIRFAHNDRFLFLLDDFLQPRFWDRLFESFDSKESAYGLALHAVRARNGFVPRGHFDIICGSPGKMKGQIGASNILNALVATKLVELESHVDLGQCVSLRPEVLANDRLAKPGAVRARMIAEDLLLSGLKEWIRNTALGSYEKIKLRSMERGPDFGQFRWDLTAPSYVHPLSRFNRSKSAVKPGFIVADVLLNDEISLPQLKPFLKKVAMMRAQRNTSPFLGMFIASRYTRSAFEAGRKAGILIATVESFFGHEMASALIDLMGILTNAAQAINSDPALIEKLFSKLDALRGADLNVKGALFELLVARALNVNGFSIDAMNEPVRMSEGLCEIDVLGRRGGEVLSVECKGYQKNLVTLDGVKQWCEKTVPWSYLHLSSQKLYKDKKVTFEYWTSTDFTSDASDYLTAESARHHKYSIKWKNRRQVEDTLRAIADPYVLKVWDSHYRPSLMSF